MSKLNRKEFKKLLTEWNNNFINERTIGDLGSIAGFTDPQIKHIKSVPVGLNLYVIGDYFVDNKNLFTMSYILIEAMKDSSFVYKKLRSSLILKKEAIPEIIEVLEFLLGTSQFSYEKESGEIAQDKEIKEKVKSSIEQMKNDLNRLKSDSHGIMLYFPRMDSYTSDMADGSINKIGNVIDPAVWKNALSWELKHDVFHYFEDVLEGESSESYNLLQSTFMKNERINEVLTHYEVPDQKIKSLDPLVKFGSSLGDGDNFATVIPYLRSLENNDKNVQQFINECIKIAEAREIILSEEDKISLKEFFKNSHKCYEEIGKILKDKIIIQKSHG